MTNDIYLRVSSEDELYHFGILGQKWGIRRYQNEDGTLTEEGRRHYGKTFRSIEKNYYDAKSREKANMARYDRNGNDKYYTKAMEASNVASKLESNCWKAIASAIQDGYDVDIVSAKKMNRELAKNVAIPTVIGGIPAGLCAGAYNAVAYGTDKDTWSVDTNKYKVRKSSSSQGNLTIRGRKVDTTTSF